jgi:hypothetical protein
MSTYYVSAASGDNGNSGLTEALAWATIDHGMNTVAPGDHVYVKSDGNYNELVTLDTVGSGANYIVFEGYSGTIGDNERATIDAQNTRANCLVDSIANGLQAFYVFKNLRFTDATGNGIVVECSSLKFKNCRVDSCASWGHYTYGAVLEDCEFDNNGEGSFYTNNHTYLGCKFSNNGNGDANGSIDTIFYGCTFFSAVEYGIYVHTTANFTYVFNCTFDGDSKDTGIAFDCEFGDKQLVSVNNLFYDNGVALRHPIGQRCVSMNNLFHNNTSKYQLGADTYTDEIEGDPAFIDEGANDYRLEAGSSGIFNGFDFSKIKGFFPGGMDIGAFQVLGSGSPSQWIETSGDRNLSMGGHLDVSDQIDYSIHGYAPKNKSLNLIFTYPSFHNYPTLDFFLKAPEPVNDSIDVFVHGHALNSNTIGLYTSAQFVQTIVSLYIKGEAVSPEEDTFGISLDQLIKNADFNPQIIGRFTTEPSSVTIELWDLMNNNSPLSLSSYDCYEIGDTDRWAWSTINLPPLTKRVNQFVYRMTANTAEVFEGDFIVKIKKIGKERGR